jgi:pimeloyl-ACP methyl ester carboxylesterase
MRLTLTSPDKLVSGSFSRVPSGTADTLVVCIHGGGCNGRYFELKSNSTVDAALARGFDVLVLDRPGYGGNQAPPTASPISDTAPRIRDFIEQVRAAHAPHSGGIGIIGHSIGGAIAVTMAAQRGEWPLRAMAISGIGDVSPPTIRNLRHPSGVTHIPPPQELTDGLFFDPDRQLKWKPVASLRAAAEPWLVTEVVEVVERWPADWRRMAERVDIPVHLRLAEHERIWETGEDVVERMASALAAAPVVDSALLPRGGHLYEATAEGPKFVQSQLDFLEKHSS